MRTSISFSIAYILVYCWAFYYTTAYIIFLMPIGWLFVMLWVIYTILKDKKKPTKTFEEYFYQDEDIRQ